MITNERAEELGRFYRTHSKEIGECMTCWMLVFDCSDSDVDIQTGEGSAKAGDDMMSTAQEDTNTVNGNKSERELRDGNDNNISPGKDPNYDRFALAMHSKYRSLLDIRGLRDDIIFTFTSFSAQLSHLGAESDLQILCNVGHHLVKPALIAAKSLIEGESDDFGENNEIPIELELPEKFKYHSIFSCPVTWERSVSQPIGYDVKEKNEISSGGVGDRSSLFPFPLPRMISSSSPPPPAPPPPLSVSPAPAPAPASSNTAVSGDDISSSNESSPAGGSTSGDRGCKNEITINQAKSPNPPVLLVCGHCILLSSMETLSVNRTRRFKCPTCYRDNSAKEVVELIF